MTVVAFAARARPRRRARRRLRAKPHARAALFPYAVTLQVTPIVAIAPLILIWVGIDNAERAVLILATIVAFFPILANTTVGLRSADPPAARAFRSLPRLALAALVSPAIPGRAALPPRRHEDRGRPRAHRHGRRRVRRRLGQARPASPGCIIEAGYRLHIAKMFAALALLAPSASRSTRCSPLLEWRVLKAGTKACGPRNNWAPEPF